MNTAYDRIRTGLEEALAFARGTGPGTVHHVPVPPPAPVPKVEPDRTDR